MQLERRTSESTLKHLLFYSSQRYGTRPSQLFFLLQSQSTFLSPATPHASTNLPSTSNPSRSEPADTETVVPVNTSNLHSPRLSSFQTSIRTRHIPLRGRIGPRNSCRRISIGSTRTSTCEHQGFQLIWPTDAILCWVSRKAEVISPFIDGCDSELAKFGHLHEMHVCDNVGDHLQGNVYARYEWEAEAGRAVNELNARWYGGE